MRFLVSCMVIGFLFSPLFSQDDRGTTARQEALFEKRFGVILYDPYRWMENKDDPQLYAWIDQQKAKTADYVSGELFTALSAELTALLQPKPVAPSVRQLQNYQLLRRHRSTFFQRFRPDNPEEEVAPGMVFSPHEQFQVAITSDSKSDLSRLEIYDNATGQRLSDVLMVLFPEIFWSEDEKSFLYTTHRDGRIGQVLPAVFRHVLGTSQPSDQLIYQGTEVGQFISLYKYDSEWLVAMEYGEENSIGFFNDSTGAITPILQRASGLISPVAVENDTLYFINFRNAPMGKISALAIRTGAIKDVVPQQKLVIDKAIKIENTFYIAFVENAASKLMRFDCTNPAMQQIPLPADGSVQLYDDNDSLLVYFSSYSESSSYWKYQSGENKLVLVAAGDALPFALESFRTYYRCHNGGMVPIWVVKKSGVALTPQTPLYIYGYGGFALNILPSLNITYLPWYKRGGVCAFVTLPGGLEYGQEWHKAGMLDNKVHVFDDFAAAARHLIRNGYTSSNKLVCNGRSNGGLLAAAAANRYPRLFRVAVPEVGVLDLERFQLFTAGKYWTSEYGNRENNHDFRNLLRLSPYHTIYRQDYPSMLIMTSDFDDRVVPLHSCKYAARLQTQQQSDNPVLFYMRNWGSHGLFSGTIKEQVNYSATRWAFIMKELGMN
ncbi:MAG: S9 family peptidase [Chitinivibrionales bacterium]|nr:S9 family peptidase [Chitinivibrionales bacterium]